MHTLVLAVSIEKLLKHVTTLLLCFLDVMENVIARTDQTNLQVVPQGNVELVHSSVRMATARHPQQFVMELMIVVTVLMNNSAICHAQN